MKSPITFSILLFLYALQFGFTSKQSAEEQYHEQKPLVVFLVRHAEKTDAGRDPGLTEAGKERALELAKILRSAKIEHVHSSDYIRTRETAEPTAKELGLTTEIYDPRDLESLAQKLRDTGGTHLVVGHSNTTPVMVRLLGGDPGTEINEKNEYDRLYIITDPGGGNISSVLIRYGDPYYSGSNVNE